ARLRRSYRNRRFPKARACSTRKSALAAKNTKIQHPDGPDHQDEAYEMHVHLAGLASESLQNAESFCQHAISFRFGFRIRSAAGHEKGCPAMKRCPAVDKTISGVEQLL